MGASILRVSYKARREARPADIPAPRLQLRWEETPSSEFDRVCHYELVFPLREHDCRNNARTGFGVVQLGRTRQAGAPVDWGTDLGCRTPFRDGVHAQWDAPVFGNLPIYVVAPNGAYALMDNLTHNKEAKPWDDLPTAPALSFSGVGE